MELEKIDLAIYYVKSTIGSNIISTLVCLP